MGAAQHRAHTELRPALPDRTSIAEHLVLDGTGQGGGETLVLAARPPSTSASTSASLSRACTNTLTVPTYSWQRARKSAAWSGVGESQTGTMITRSLMSSMAWIARRRPSASFPGSRCPLSQDTTSASTVTAVAADAGTLPA